MKDIFIIGCKGLPGNYGGFETFTDYLVSHKKSQDVMYHVACLSDHDGEREYNGARLFDVKVPSIGPAKVIYYDLRAMKLALKYIEENHIQYPEILMLGCTAGPFLGVFYKKMKKYNVKFLINVDGHEWKRTKWIKPIRVYLKYSEKKIVQHCDLVVSDSIGIENYILREYKQYNPISKFIAYGADIHDDGYAINRLDDLYEWYKKHDIIMGDYYLIVGRFVPENNYETMIREFMASHTKKKLVIITNVEKNKFYNALLKKTHFDQDRRIVFAGTLYDSELLYLVRKNAFAYIHGHEVGGTNPSLLESLAVTKLNLLLGVDFNTTVGESACKYFNKQPGNLSGLIDSLESISEEERDELGNLAKQRIRDHYTWDFIIDEYEGLFKSF